MKLVSNIARIAHEQLNDTQERTQHLLDRNAPNSAAMSVTRWVNLRRKLYDLERADDAVTAARKAWVSTPTLARGLAVRTAVDNFLAHEQDLAEILEEAS